MNDDNERAWQIGITACIAACVLALLWVGVRQHRGKLVLAGTEARAVGVMSTPVPWRENPDYYCLNKKTGDCYAHYPIFGTGCDEGYIVSYVPCAIPTPTPTAPPTPTATPTPTQPPAPYEHRGTYTALEGLNVYAPCVVEDGAKLRMYFGGWYGQEDYGSDRIYLAESPDGGLIWGNVRKVVDVDVIGGTVPNAHVNNPSVVRSGDGWLMAFGGAVVEGAAPRPGSLSAWRQQAPENLHDAVWLADSQDGVTWANHRKLIDYGAEPTLFDVGGETWLLYCDRQTWEIRATKLTLPGAVSGTRTVLGVQGVYLGNVNVTVLPDGKYLVLVGCGCGATGDVMAWVTADPRSITWAGRWTLHQGGQIEGQPCGWFDASAYPQPWGFEVYAGEALWKNGECPVWEGTRRIVRAQYAPVGMAIPTPTPTPTPWVPACPVQPDLQATGWYWNAEVEVNAGVRLIVLANRETCYYVKRWTGSTNPAWVRYGNQGPWVVQGLYPVPAHPVRMVKVEVFVPGTPNAWAGIVREVYPAEGVTGVPTPNVN